MYFVDNQNHYDASTNIALETYLVENRLVDEPILLFYINDPSIIIGRNQNTIEEINRDYVAEHGINVVRRMSGGGAVYHDRGNLSFCFIKDDDNTFRDFNTFTKPVIKALHNMGVKDAELRGRNDLVIGERKFSGNAMYMQRGRMTAHGTILYNSDLDVVTQALKPAKEKIESKGIKSIRSRVTNILPHMDEQWQDLSTEAFRDRLLLEIFDVEHREDVREYHLTDQDWAEVERIRAERFANWDWNYGHSPKFALQRRHKFPAGLVDVRLDVEKGKVTALKIYGDFFGLGNLSELEDALIGHAYQAEAIEATLNTLDLQHYLGNIEAAELARLIA
ncbi:lipoate--protein ligase [Suttonella sp. R2A3]|uniref:lipoate--protein ligase n=1 Tax=Suttonella sp. R2A3 TaxID=2908648 RepID=UPI001F36FCD6|nr:lipoate--protein ligase [Suttonella sp. R2A3]UJF25257.1 lipoate--protein ligase [Suttonella sp. R2A3]